MKGIIPLFLIVFLVFIKCNEGFSQNSVTTLDHVNKTLDSLSGKGVMYKRIREKPEIKLNKEQSLLYLQSRYKSYNWNNPGDPLRQAIGQLLYFASDNQFDSTKNFLDRYSYDSINIPWDKFYVWDTLKIKIPVITPAHFISTADTIIKTDSTLKVIISDSLKPGIAVNISDLISKNAIPLVGLKDFNSCCNGYFGTGYKSIGSISIPLL
jgi:hypothetical protein